MRLIDADELTEMVWRERLDTRERIANLIARQPTIERSLKRGEWEEISEYNGWGDTHYRCSVCDEEWFLEDGTPKQNNMNFCPQCGADMRGTEI